MSGTEIRPAFRQRVRAVTRQMWALHVARGLALLTVVGAVLVAVAATADYLFEFALPGRVALLVAGFAVLAILTTRWVVRPARTWGRTQVAIVLEALFPRLGQRLRTTVEYGPRSATELASAGVAPTLVAALESETAEKAKPLPFQAALPLRPVFVASGVAILCIALLAAAATYAPEWGTALSRATLSPVAYTVLTVTASADQVDEGQSVQITATMTGRARPDVILHFRETGNDEWRDEPMEAGQDGFTAEVTRLRSTIEFYVTAGPERSPTQEVLVRRPLKITATRIEVRSPEYTRVPVTTHETGGFSAIQGSTAQLSFELDRSPTSATLVVMSPANPKKPPERINMAIQDRHISAVLPLSVDIEYTIEATDGVGLTIVPNKSRVRVTTDQPPTVWLEEPAESTEVHTLAEVRIRARARDDFGVMRVGIVFQVNNEEERILIVKDADSGGHPTLLAEQILMLEQFLLTEKDCVAYYAFAEDNRADAPQRVVTDLRFIDIRPFKRVYKLREPNDEEMGGPQRELIFLDEVIARQRFNLNQTIRLESRSKVRLDVTQVDKVAAYENKLATQTHELADFLLGLGVDGVALLTQAEETMLSAVDSLQGAKFTTAIGQERDALRYLMEARNTVQRTLTKASKSARAQARAFDRLQRQKIRMQDQNAETLAAIAGELTNLAQQEGDVTQLLAVATKMPSPAPTPTGAGGGSAKGPMEMNNPGPNGKPDPDKPGTSEKPNSDKPGEGPPDPTKPAPDQKGGMEPATKPGDMGADPTQEKQDEIAARASVLDKTAAKAKGLTGLAKTRIAEATKAANAAADALGQKDKEGAKKNAEQARDLFQLVAKQVAALAAEEAAQQLAAARDLANELAARTAPEPATPAPAAGQQAAAPMPGMGKGGKEQMPGLGMAAEQAKTLKDVLDQIAGAGTEGSTDAARRAAELLKGEDLGAAIGRLEKPGAGGDRNERQDLAERFAALGQKLDQAYRELVAPRLEEIARLDKEAGELQKRLAAAEDDVTRQRVAQQVAEFVEKLEKARLGEAASDDLRAGVQAGARGAGLQRINRGLAYAREQLTVRLQEFVAGDRFTTGVEAVPPEYRDLVERYLRALSTGSKK